MLSDIKNNSSSIYAETYYEWGFVSEFPLKGVVVVGRGRRGYGTTTLERRNGLEPRLSNVVMVEFGVMEASFPMI